MCFLPLNAHPRSNHPTVQHHPSSIPSSIHRFQNGKTALMWARQNGHSEVVKLLEEKAQEATAAKKKKKKEKKQKKEKR